MKPLFEMLETRSVLSASPVVSIVPQSTTATPAITAAATVTIPSVLGTWKGTLAIPGVHSQTVKIVFTSQNRKGVLAGVMTTPADPSIRVAVTGKVTSTGAVYVTLVGNHKGGSINGTGSGKLKSGATRLTLTMTFTQGGSKLPGTITLKKA